MKLENGICKLQDGVSKLENGICRLQDGVSKLQNADSNLQNDQLKLQNTLLKLRNDRLKCRYQRPGGIFGIKIRLVRYGKCLVYNEIGKCARQDSNL